MKKSVGMTTTRLEDCKKVGRTGIDLIAICLIAFVFAANLIRTSRVSLSEVVSYSASFLYVLFIPAVLACAYLYLKIAAKFDVKRIFITFSIAYLIAGAYWIFNTNPCIRADASLVWSAAGSFLHGDFSPLSKEGYIGMFPYQLGMATYDLILRAFSGNSKILYAANLLEVLLINRFGYKLTDELFGDETVSRLVLFLEFAFLPQFLFIMFGYGIIPGFCCLMIALYFCLRVYKGGRPKDIGLLILFSTLAALIKPNFKIGVIAMAIILVLKPTKEKKQSRRPILAAAAMMVCAFGAFGLLKAAYSAVSHTAIGEGTPIVVHIAMGTDLNNEVRAPGWYDGYTYAAYPAANYDTETAAQNAKEKIKGNISESLAEPMKAASFYWRKILSTWCEPMFQSAWSGPKGSESVTTRVLLSLYNGGKLEKLAALYAKADVVIIFAAALCFAVKRRDEFPFARALYLYFIGGFIFHFFSETKSQYVYMYVFAMLPLAAYELNRLMAYVQALRRKKKRQKT